MKKVFVTGGSGFIGSNLIKRLVEEGCDVAVLWRPNSRHPLIDGINFKRCAGDLNYPDSLSKGMEGCDTVFHLAAKVSFNRFEYPELYRINVEGTEKALKAAIKKGVKRFIHLSACAVLGYSNDKKTVIDENSRPDIPRENVYAYTKKLAEDKVLEASKRGLDAVIINPSTVYGQGDITLNSGFLIKSIYNGRLKIAPPGGTSVVSVDDVVEGIILAAEKGKKGERYILSNAAMEYIGLCSIIADALKVNGPRLKMPSFLYAPAVASVFLVEALLKIVGRPHPLFTVQVARETFGYKYYSSKKAREELRWNPRVGIKEAVEKAFSFYKKEGLIQ